MKLLHLRASLPYKTGAEFDQKNILMQAGDVERNPGPRDTQTPKKCDSYGLTMKRTMRTLSLAFFQTVKMSVMMPKSAATSAGQRSKRTKWRTVKHASYTGLQRQKYTTRR